MQKLQVWLTIALLSRRKKPAADNETFVDPPGILAEKIKIYERKGRMEKKIMQIAK